MKRKVAVVVGSKTDLTQCERGIEWLRTAHSEGLIELQGIHAMSIHRNTDEVLDFLDEVGANLDVLIIGAGWANHLTGTCDAFLRYSLKNASTVVIGVAFADEKDESKTLTAIRSIQHVPGTQVLFEGFVGEKGFTQAVERAVTGVLPTLKLPEPKPSWHGTADEALELIKQLKSKS